MKLIQADYERRLELPGVPVPVRRPVDIDRSRTGFTSLRSLRIYQFDAQSVINGHAEEDEVFVIVMAGSVEFSVTEAHSESELRSFTLSAVSSSHNDACVAYLSPHSAYRLTPQTDADVAYVRAIPVTSRPSTVFVSHLSKDAAGITILFEEMTYAQRLRLRLLQVDARVDNIVLTLVNESGAPYEALVHIQTTPAEQVATIASNSGSVQLTSWDTVAIASGDRPILSVHSGSSALVLVALAV